MKHILIFAGTTEGRTLMEKMKHFPVELFVSVATEYGKECLMQTTDIMKDKTGYHGKVQAGNIHVIAGRMTKEEMAEYIKDQEIDAVIDATHPFATEVTKNIKEACEQRKTPYYRVLRRQDDPERTDDAGNDVVYVSSVSEGVAWLKQTEGNILITTGSKELFKYKEIPDYRERCFARVLSTKEAVEESVRTGFEGSHLIAMQGPYSFEMNVALLRHVNASYMITKESGSVGGFEEKARAAMELGVTLIVVERPKERGYTLEEIVERMKECSLQ